MTAVRSGAEILVDVVGNFDADPRNLGQVFGLSLGEVFGAASSMSNTSTKR